MVEYKLAKKNKNKNLKNSDLRGMRKSKKSYVQKIE